jgi:nucleoside-diphosphate-sugar epimerase
MKIGVTGATGYIGDRFVKRAQSSGYEVVALSRQQPELYSSDWIPYELSSRKGPVLPENTDVILHLATGKSPIGQEEMTHDILAAKLLITSTQNVGAKLIFVSSQTARPDAPTAYGRTKWRIEQLVLAAGGCVVRPGQVYGGKPLGLFGELLHTVQHLPILPAFLPAPRVQPIHVDDLSLGLLRIAERADISCGVLCLGSIVPVTFTEFLGSIAHDRLRLSRTFVPVPSFVVVRIAAKRFERLRSLFDLPAMATEADLLQLGLCLRPLDSGMHPSGDDRRRRLVIEGRAFLAYVLKEQSSEAVLRNYLRVIENLRGGNALGLPKVFVQWPVLLAIIGGANPIATAWKKEYVWRLGAATVLAEATSFGAKRFLGLGESFGFVASFFGITRAVLAEAGWRLLALVLAPVTRIVLPRTWDEQR